MDSRKALEQNTVLHFRNAQGGAVSYQIREEIGRGGLSIVYNAFYTNNLGKNKIVRIKECYPFSVSIQRGEHQELIAASEDEERFFQYKKRFEKSFETANRLFEVEGLTNAVTNSMDIYEHGNTLYIVSTYMEGEILSEKTDLSLKDSLFVIRSAARTIRKIHEQGYLYLDLKPENILVLNEVTDLIQLFDFDSLYRIDPKKGADTFSEEKISFTRGYAALEQQMGEIRKFGKHTDVYGLGAVLFFQIFHRPPSASDCEEDSVYSFLESRFPKEEYSPILFEKLTEFFHHTLSGYYPDRFSCMTEVMEALEEILPYAEARTPYLQSARILPNKAMIGRMEELAALNDWLDSACGILAVTGMGGIGKSTLVREFLTQRREVFSNVLYTYQTKDLKTLVCDEEQFKIRWVEQGEEESQEEYFLRKLGILDTILNEGRDILVIDDFTGFEEPEFEALCRRFYKVILISREESLERYADQVLRVGKLKEKKEQLLLLETFLQRRIPEEELNEAEQILDCVEGHTLILELIARQIANSYLSLAEAAGLVQKVGFSRVGREQIEYQKDRRSSYQTIQGVLDSLFDLHRLSGDSYCVLKTLSLFPSSGIDIHFFQKLQGLSTKDPINQLKRSGWIMVDGQKICIHPVIREWARQRDWNEHVTEAVQTVLKNLRVELHEAGQREEFPEYLRKRKEPVRASHPLRWILGFRRKTMLEEIREERTILGIQKNRSNESLRNRLLRYSISFLTACRDMVLSGSEDYRELLYRTIINLSEEQEAFVFEYVDLLLDGSGDSDPAAKLKLCDHVSFLYQNSRDLDRAFQYIQLAEEITKEPFSDPHYLLGLFYEMLWQYYDTVLDGQYYGSDPEHLGKQKQAMELCILHMRKSGYPDARPALFRHLVSKAIILSRSEPKKRRQIEKILKEADGIRQSIPDQIVENRYAFDMALGWYHTYVIEDAILVQADIRRARAENCLSDLEYISSVLSPAANMLLELKHYKEAKAYLWEGISICEKYRTRIPYIRKEIELYYFLWWVICDEKDFTDTAELLKLTKETNRRCERYGIPPFEIPEELYELVEEADPGKMAMH